MRRSNRPEDSIRSFKLLLFTAAMAGQMMAVGVKRGASPEFGTPTRLFDADVLPSQNPSYTRNQYAVTADGQRFLIVQPAAKGSIGAVTVVVDWTTMVKGRPGT